MPDKKLFLLDAYALIYRAYYAFIRNPRYNTKGLNTSAPFGFVNTLDEVLRIEKPTHIAVVFDTPTPTFRHERYKEYKANREAMPDDLRASIPYIRRIIEAYNIPIIEKPGFEADDVIGTLAKRAEVDGFKVFMMTPDKDYCQLVSENIVMYKPRKGGNEPEVWGIAEVQENFMVQTTDQVIEVLGLMGDASDNIPGAPGIGEKTAKKLIHTYGSIEKLYEKIHDLKGKQKETLLAFRKQVELSKELVTICLDVPIEFHPGEMKMEKPNFERLRSVFEELEFRGMSQRLIQDDVPVEEKPVVIQKVQQVKVAVGEAVQGSLFGDIHFITTPAISKPAASQLDTIATVKHDYRLVDRESEIDLLIEKLGKQKEFCFDTETTGIDANIAELVGMSFCYKAGEAFYVPFPDKRGEALQLLDKFKGIFADASIRKIGQNIKYDMLILSWYNIELKGELFDTMLAHYLIQPELRHNMDFMAEQLLNYKTISIEELIGKKGKNQLNMRDIDVAIVKDYAAEDADITFRLKEILEKDMETAGALKLFREIEMPLVYVLVHMEKTGVRINVENLDKYGDELRIELSEQENEIYRLAGQEFNISSPKQLGDILFDKLNIDGGGKKTKTEQFSTGEEVLVKLKDKHEIVAKILDFRSLKKLLSTYIEALPKLLNPKTNRLHTSFNQARVATGRLSSDNPNLQNIPIREDRGREIRKAFIPSDKEHTFLSADYSQVELRLMAHMSEDPDMIEAFRQNEDIHTATAAKIYKTKIEEVTREMRNSAKTANFGIIYGISAFGLAQRLNIKRTDAKILIDSYFESYPKVKQYMDDCIARARDNGYVETLMNRRRYLGDINSRNATEKNMAERNAINAPIQGSAADIIKIAMIRILQRMQERGLRSQMIMQVHDELNFNAYIPELNDLKQIVKDEMQNAVSLSVPLLVDMGSGDNWMEAH